MARQRQCGPSTTRLPGARPTAHDLTALKASNRRGLSFVLVAAALTTIGIFLSTLTSWLIWTAGQLLLATSLMQWFVILHECGHGTLVRNRSWHRPIGHLASIFSLLPYTCWKLVHARHHKWTGWQDLDPTTQGLVPRPLGRLESLAIDLCWRCWIPLFSILYRLTIFWNLPRLWRLFPIARTQWRLALNIVGLGLFYAALLGFVGPTQAFWLFVPALAAQFIFQDPLMLSQHTHIPQHLAGDAAVQPFPAAEQEIFTRSLVFPRWFSAGVLLNFDAHELHHMYPWVPGYLLDRINYRPSNEINWWRWVRMAKQLPARTFLFENRHHTHLDL